MTLILNKPTCVTSGANTGIPKCIFDPAKMKGVILVPDTLAMTNANLEGFKAFIQPLVMASDATRVFPIGGFGSLTDNTPEPTFKTYGYGDSKLVKEGPYDFTWELIKGGHDYNASLRKFNNVSKMKAIIWDSDDNIWMTRSGVDGGKGFSFTTFHAFLFKPTNGDAEPASYRLRMVFDRPEEFNDDLVYFNLGESPEDAFKGNLDIELYLISQTSTKAVIGVRTVSGKVSLYDAYSSDLASLDLWNVTKSGAGVTPTGIAAVPNVGPDEEGGWELTLTTPTGAHLFVLDSAADLATGGVGGSPDNAYEAAAGLTVTFS